MATAQLGTLIRHIKELAAGRATRHWTDRQLLDEFAARRDESAFANLVGRHGPMVLRVCRRVLGHEQDAEDAFQATFLVLARHAASIRKREALADWLYGVAYRTAMNAKRSAARRRNHEAKLRDVKPTSVPGPAWDDVQAVLDEEIRRLPGSFRSAFVLCILEGKTVPSAAAELGVKEGTLSWRLARARQLLRRRLSHRGIELSALLAALSLVEGASTAALPAVLVQTTVCHGLLVAAGVSAAGVIPPHVAALATGVTKAMFLTNAKIAALVVVVASLCAAGAGVLTRQALAAKAAHQAATKAEPPAPKETAKPQAAKQTDEDAVTYGGRVLDPDGKPVAGAKLYMRGGYPNKAEAYSREELSPLDATTGPDGRFKFAVSKVKYAGTPTLLTAMVANYGAGWVEIPADGRRDDLTLQLVQDDVPITGQVVDLEGKPVAGATLRLVDIKAAPGDDLGPWLAAVKAKKGLDPRLPYPYQMLEMEHLTRYTHAVSGKATTDAEGRFRLTGIGRNRVARVQIDGPTIVSQFLRILTRPGAAIEAIVEGDGQSDIPRAGTAYYGANFRHAAAPSRPIVGVVRDKDTKEPLAGVTIRSLNGLASGTNVQTTTDAQGRYRLTGMPKSKGNMVVAIPPRGLPYVAISSNVPATDGLDPATANLEMKRGVWIEGKITDKATGKPVRAHVEFFAQTDNPNLRDYPGFDAANLDLCEQKEDGSYRVVGLPGPGLLAVRFGEDGYLRASERDDEYGRQSPEGDLDTFPVSLMLIYYHAVASVDPAKAARSVNRDLTLDPGWTFTGTVLGPDGKPLAGARGFGLTNMASRAGWDGEARKTAEFTVRAFNPRRPREVFFQHPETGLVGVVQAPKENGGAVTVRMEPGAVVTGRLVDADGRPRAGVELELTFRRKEGVEASGSPQRIQTDREGLFRIGALLPGYEYRLSDRRGDLLIGHALRPGETKDLGDVQVKPFE
jgi:RNA polymerase sigma factor (sigma-70 family)